MARPLSPLELQEMAERLPTKHVTKARRKTVARKNAVNRVAGRASKRRK